MTTKTQLNQMLKNAEHFRSYMERSGYGAYSDEVIKQLKDEIGAIEMLYYIETASGRLYPIRADTEAMAIERFKAIYPHKAIWYVWDK